MALPFCSLCVLVFNRYDLLAECLLSAVSGRVIPDAVFIIDNGRCQSKVDKAIEPLNEVFIYTPKEPMGVAESWNWFIDNVPEVRVVTSDDVTFGVNSLATLMDSPATFVSPVLDPPFACFLLKDKCVETVGRFDETISPGYIYFEDWDYTRRMEQAGIPVTIVECGVKHVGSATLRVKNEQEMAEHHRRFLIAQSNYLKKWGQLPAGVEVQR
jgi:hypothetical protein